jgi:hypothetical protein
MFEGLCFGRQNQREWILYKRMGCVCVFWTIDLFLEIPARRGK